MLYSSVCWGGVGGMLGSIGYFLMPGACFPQAWSPPPAKALLRTVAPPSSASSTLLLILHVWLLINVIIFTFLLSEKLPKNSLLICSKISPHFLPVINIFPFTLFCCHSTWTLGRRERNTCTCCFSITIFSSELVFVL